MVPLKIIRKIGKILRGGAGWKEIFLGTLCGVLIGFNPGMSATLLIAVLITLLLNANISFVLLGAALGKALCLILAPLTFHTGYFIIHSIGLEGLFRGLCNAPVTALMDLNVYAMVGSLPYALVIGAVVGAALGSAVLRIRKKMVEADQHEIIGKTFGNKFSRLLLRLAFGKSKLSLDDEIPKQAPLLRKSGLILVGIVLVIGLLLDVLLLDMALKKSLQSSISAVTGAEVNIGKVHFSITRGELEIEDLQVTDPDKPTHNLIQLEAAAVDVSIRDLLRNSYVIDLMSGHTLQRDVPRKTPGRIYEKSEPEEVEEEATAAGWSLGEYSAKARNWKRYGEKAHEYLSERKLNIKAAQTGEQRVPSREAAVADAKTLGYLNAAADLVADRPAWTVRKMEIRDVRLGDDRPAYLLEGEELSSHPEMNGKPTILAMTREEAPEPDALLVLRFDSADALHGLNVNIGDIPVGDAAAADGSAPVVVRDGSAAFKIDGEFSVDTLQLPFAVSIRDLKAEVKEGEEIMGMDAKTANEVFNSIEQLDVEGILTGSLISPRVQIDYEKLTAHIREALVAAGKKELSRRASAEMDKAKDELEKRAGEELDKALESEEARDLKDKASESLKKLF